MTTQIRPTTEMQENRKIKIRDREEGENKNDKDMDCAQQKGDVSSWDLEASPRPNRVR